MAALPEALVELAKDSTHRTEPGAWSQHSVLIVDDEEGMRSFLLRTLKPRCGRVEVAGSAENGREWVRSTHFDLVILDIALPGKNGIEWLAELRAGGYAGDVILITAFADMETAIHALRAGAQDFILKPFRVDQILNSIKRCFDRARLLRENFVLRREAEARAEGFIGTSAATRNLVALIARIAATHSTVLITGESGVGKEVAARALHRLSPRAERPFVPVNCAAISAELMESELFGHVKGAFTGATENHAGLFYYAQGGTLFLDEIAELSLTLQTKLLRVLEDRRIRAVGSTREQPVDVRILAATNRDLSVEVARGRFRQDLFYRLDVMNLRIAPLRERMDDVLPIAEHFIAELAPALGVQPMALTAEVRERMLAYDWPGNVRELRNFIERSLILGYLPAETLPASYREEAREEEDDPGSDRMEDVEKRHILKVLREAGGNKSEAARRLGVSRKTLERKCALWGVDS